MRIAKNNGYIGNYNSSFLSCEKDLDEIIKRLFVDNQPCSDELKRLLVINTKDCLDNRTNPEYNKKVRETTVGKLIEEGYVRYTPKLARGENQESQTYIIITFDNFAPNNSNEYYRDCTVMIDILCHPDNWDIGNYRIRPLKIAGYIDAILNGARLSGIGTFNFISCNELVIDEDLCGYCLLYSAVHGVDDALPVEEE